MTFDMTAAIDTMHKALTVALALVLWLRKPGSDALAALAKHKAEVAEAAQAADEHRAGLDRRVAVLEERSEHMPTAPEIADLRAAMSGLTAEVAGQRAQLARIENYLLSKS